MTIYKYQFQITDEVKIEMPIGAKILSLQVQDGIPTIWALVNPDLMKVERVFRIYGTGHPITDLAYKLPNNVMDVRVHIGTIQLNGFVWHVFH